MRASKRKQDAWRVDSPQFAIGVSPSPRRGEGGAVFYNCLFALFAGMLKPICCLHALLMSTTDI